MVQINHPAKQLKHPQLAQASQPPHSHRNVLNSIAEEDESLADTSVADFDITEFPGRNHTRLVGKAQFINALAGSDYDEGSKGSETGMEEEIDLEVSSGSTTEDEEEDSSLSQPVKRLKQLPSNSHIMKSRLGSHRSQATSTKSQRKKHVPNLEDPSTCRKLVKLEFQI